MCKKGKISFQKSTYFVTLDNNLIEVLFKVCPFTSTQIYTYSKAHAQFFQESLLKQIKSIFVFDLNRRFLSYKKIAITWNSSSNLRQTFSLMKEVVIFLTLLTQVWFNPAVLHSSGHTSVHQQHIITKKYYHMLFSLADPRERQGRLPSLPPGSISFIFMQFLGKIRPNVLQQAGVPTLAVGALPSGKSWIRHWFYITFQTKITSIFSLVKLLNPSSLIVLFVSADIKRFQIQFQERLQNVTLTLEIASKRLQKRFYPWLVAKNISTHVL